MSLVELVGIAGTLGAGVTAVVDVIRRFVDPRDRWKGSGVWLVIALGLGVGAAFGADLNGLPKAETFGQVLTGLVIGAFGKLGHEVMDGKVFGGRRV